MLPTVPRRWSWCYSYFVWLLIWFSIWFSLRCVSCWALPCSLFSCFSPFSIWERESWFMCFSCICLFILHALICVRFLFLLVSGVGCGLWLWHPLHFSINAFCISQLIQFPRVFSHVADLNTRNKHLTAKLLKQGCQNVFTILSTALWRDTKI